MKRMSLAVFVLAAFATACGSSSSPNSPTSTRPTFTADLRPANEVPPISDAEASGSGNVTVTFDITRDAANNITAATATFVVNLSGFPAGTPINIAHIHQSPAGTNGTIVISTSLQAGEVVLANGSGSFTKSGIPVQQQFLASVQQILDNPSGFYFNVHSTAHPGGVARGQLVRVQ